MSRFPNYIESDLAKNKRKVPPRNRRKEIDVYVYTTNQDITTVETTDGSLAIQAKLLKTVKMNSTTPLNFDIAKPKFASVSDSAVWGTQINGFVYEELQLEPSKYNFISFTVVTQSNVKAIAKYRVVNYSPVDDNDNNLLYASVSLLLDSIKTIPMLESFNWKIVNNFDNDTKTKYIKIEFQNNTMLGSDGLKIEGREDTGFSPRKIDYTLNQSPDLTLLYIKVRNKDPLEIDLPEINRLSQRPNVSGRIIYANWIDPLFGEKFAFKSIETTETLLQAINNDSWSWVNGGGAMKRLDYFSDGIDYKLTGTAAYLKQKELTTNDIGNFLAGLYNISSEVPEPLRNIATADTLVKTEELDKNNADDRKYYVLARKYNLGKWFTLIAQTGRVLITAIEPINTPYKSNLIRKNEIDGLIASTEKDSFTLEIELNIDVFNPLLEFNTLVGDEIKITTYAADHKIIDNELNFQTNDNGDTKIQL